MATRNISFLNHDNIELAAKMEMPAGEQPSCYAIFAHCFSSSKDLKAVRYIARELNAHNIAVLRFDFTGLGESEGDFSDTNFSSNVEDIISAAEFCAREFDVPKILIGHSFGGTASLAAANYLEHVKAVSTIGSPYEASHVAHHLDAVMSQIQSKGKAEVEIGGRAITIKKQFLDDIQSVDMDYFIHNLDKALLIFHSPIDDTVGIENAAKIYQAAKHPKSFISLDKADHLLLNENDAKYVARILATWACNYV